MKRKKGAPDGAIEIVAKATVVEADAPGVSHVAPYADDAQAFGAFHEILVPPYDPVLMYKYYQRSSSLRPNVEALMTNIETFGFVLRARVDVKDRDAKDKIVDALLTESIETKELSELTVEYVEAKLHFFEALARHQRLRAEAFLSRIAADSSLIELRKQRREDLSVTGNAYYEVVRSQDGEIAELKHAPSPWMRLTKQGAEIVPYERYVRISPFKVITVQTRRRFRRFVQVDECSSQTPVVWFKEFGDPRVMSATSGRFYCDEAALKREERERGIVATEIYHFRIHNPLSAYGVPPWIGALLAVYGTRQSEEVNVAYFGNKAVPPMAILVSGGSLRSDSAESLKSYIRDHIKNKDHFHDVLVLEAAPAASGAIAGASHGQVRIEIVPLMSAQQQDALFQQYEKNNELKVGAQFRIPKILRGDAADINRATSDAALRYAEQQVFQPPRGEFDTWMNDVILAERGISSVEFVSRGPIERDPEKIAELATQAASAGGLTPNEVRAAVGPALDARLEQIDEPWANIPLEAAKVGFAPYVEDEDGEPMPAVILKNEDAVYALTLNQMRRLARVPELPGADGDILFGEWKAKLESPEPSLDVTAARLMSVKDAMATVETSMHAAAMHQQRKQRLEVSQEQLDSWISRDA